MASHTTPTAPHRTSGWLSHGAKRQRLIVHFDTTDRSIDGAQHIIINDVTLQADTE